MSYGRAVFAVLGAFLLFAAGMKVSGFHIAPYAQYGWFTTPWVQLFAVGWELLIGLWLLSGVRAGSAWLMVMATFVAFAGISLSLGLMGQAHCDCFGPIQASPWVAFAVDVAAIILLGTARPPLETNNLITNIRQSFNLTTKWLAGVSGICAVLGMVGVWTFGSLDKAVARLRGESLSVTPSYVDLGDGRAGELLEAPVTISNWTETPVRLVGGTSDCSCTTTADLPLTIPAGASAKVGITLHPPQSPSGHLSRVVLLFTDCPNQPVVRFRIGCRVQR